MEILHMKRVLPIFEALFEDTGVCVSYFLLLIGNNIHRVEDGLQDSTNHLMLDPSGCFISLTRTLGPPTG